MGNQQSKIIAVLTEEGTMSLSSTSSPTIAPHPATKSWPTYIPTPPSKRRSEKDRHSRDGRKHRKPGKGGKIRHGGRHHLDSVC